MDASTDALSTSRSAHWRDRWRRFRPKLKGLLPFSAGILAALVAMLLYNVFAPGSEPLTAEDVNTIVAQVMASATPAPAYSAQVYETIAPSLVYVQTASVNANGEVEEGVGSGVVISDKGEVLTALHVVENATAIQLVFSDGTTSNATIASTQPENDIAVLQPDQLPTSLVPAVLGNPKAMDVGDEAYVVGNPFGLYASMSAGVISGFDRSFQTSDSETLIEGLIQIDTAVNPGNSGGPVLNRDGQVIGIVVGLLNPTDEEYFIGIGFAVPISTAIGAAGEGGGGPQY